MPFNGIMSEKKRRAKRTKRLDPIIVQAFKVDPPRPFLDGGYFVLRCGYCESKNLCPPSGDIRMGDNVLCRDCGEGAIPMKCVK